ncbi:hypothetical protein Tco_1056980 [Tanacetum coccineum]|uniref:Uncharacterized protein n=1 Tax=Tanacetum coccineum TaxID=301880 RepID=A0ABQ5H418_9ASTR
MLVHYQLIRADGSSKRYSSMIRMLQGIDREDLEALWRIVKTKYSDIRPEDEFERVLWGDLKVMFEPDKRSDVHNGNYAKWWQGTVVWHTVDRLVLLGTAEDQSWHHSSGGHMATTNDWYKVAGTIGNVIQVAVRMLVEEGQVAVRWRGGGGLAIRS